ncbi:MAG: sigma-E processing peptidase SpoIIGA [Oscillospiraceae bacterium]|nr:sigma-E processing peptidase SpoIIGA [Oscillospiraceae bacterium]
MIYPNVVYIDALIIINLYVNFFLIKACGAFLHRRIKTVRCVLGAVAGGISSLVILLPPLPEFLNAALKLTIGAGIVLIAFGFVSLRAFSKNALVFLIINVIFAGFMLILRLFASPLDMVYHNGVVYFDISFLALLVSTAAAYFLIRVLRYFLDVKFNADKIYQVIFKHSGIISELNAFADSGNTLTDFFTGHPVIICDKNACKDLFSELIDFENPQALPDYSSDCGLYYSKIKKGVRFLPYSTLNGSGLIPVFKPDSVAISGKNVEALIGISERGINKNGVNAIFNPKLLM